MKRKTEITYIYIINYFENIYYAHYFKLENISCFLSWPCLPLNILKIHYMRARRGGSVVPIPFVRTRNNRPFMLKEPSLHAKVI